MMKVIQATLTNIQLVYCLVQLLAVQTPCIDSFAPITTAPAKTFSKTTSTSALLHLSSSSTTTTTINTTSDDGTTTPTTSFDDFDLHSSVLKAIRSQKDWIIPTPVQELAIPQLLEKDVVWCEAPTGAGKTLAYALPLLHHLMTNKKSSSSSSSNSKIRSLIICPTRELAEQIEKVFKSLIHNLGGNKNKKQWNMIVLYGGVPRENQIAQLAECVQSKKDIDIVIATPGRLVDALQYYDNNENMATDEALEKRILSAMGKGSSSTSLSLEQIEKLQLDRIDDEGRASIQSSLLDDLEYIILDEADRILSRAFQSEIDTILDMILQKQQNNSNDNNQHYLNTWLFSATYPKHIEPRVDHVLQRIGGSSGNNNNNDTTTTTTGTTAITRISCTNSNRNKGVDDDISASLLKKLERTNIRKNNIESIGPESTIELRVVRIDKPSRTQALRYLLEQNHNNWDRVLVFVSTRYTSEHVSKKLRRVGINAAELHGKLDQDARFRRLQQFRKGKIRVLLATDVASRGLDIVGLPVVINYDLPRSTTDFVHRVGRTGRAGKKGTAITFCTPDCEAHWELIEQRHLPGIILPRETLPGFEPDEEKWYIQAEASRRTVPGSVASDKGIAHDRMFGGIKGKRKSKKDRLREKAAAAAAAAATKQTE